MKLRMNRNGRELYVVGNTKIFWSVLVKEKCRECSCVNAGHNAGHKNLVHGDTWE